MSSRATLQVFITYTNGTSVVLSGSAKTRFKLGATCRRHRQGRLYTAARAAVVIEQVRAQEEQKLVNVRAVYERCGMDPARIRSVVSVIAH